MAGSKGLPHLVHKNLMKVFPGHRIPPPMPLSTAPLYVQRSLHGNAREAEKMRDGVQKILPAWATPYEGFCHSLVDLSSTWKDVVREAKVLFSKRFVALLEFEERGTGNSEEISIFASTKRGLLEKVQKKLSFYRRYGYCRVVVKYDQQSQKKI